MMRKSVYEDRLQAGDFVAIKKGGMNRADGKRVDMFGNLITCRKDLSPSAKKKKVPWKIIFADQIIDPGNPDPE